MAKSPLETRFISGSYKPKRRAVTKACPGGGSSFSSAPWYDAGGHAWPDPEPTKPEKPKKQPKLRKPKRDAPIYKYDDEVGF